MQFVTAGLKLSRYSANRFSVFLKNIEDYKAKITFWMKHLFTDMVTDMVNINIINPI